MKREKIGWRKNRKKMIKMIIRLQRNKEKIEMRVGQCGQLRVL
jgi:hypothetical protein